MDERIAIWNTLHDGEITVISTEDNDTFTMWVNIPYIRSRLTPLGDSFKLKMEGMREIEFVDFDDVLQSFEAEMQLAQIEILSTDSKEMPVTVATTMGMLTLDFDKLTIYLDTGEEVQYSDVLKASEEYWDEWEKKK